MRGAGRELTLLLPFIIFILNLEGLWGNKYLFVVENPPLPFTSLLHSPCFFSSVTLMENKNECYETSTCFATVL